MAPRVHSLLALACAATTTTQASIDRTLERQGDNINDTRDRAMDDSKRAIERAKDDINRDYEDGPHLTGGSKEDLKFKKEKALEALDNLQKAEKRMADQFHQQYKEDVKRILDAYKKGEELPDLKKKSDGQTNNMLAATATLTVADRRRAAMVQRIDAEINGRSADIMYVADDGDSKKQSAGFDAKSLGIPTTKSGVLNKEDDFQQQIRDSIHDASHKHLKNDIPPSHRSAREELDDLQSRTEKVKAQLADLQSSMDASLAQEQKKNGLRSDALNASARVSESAEAKAMRDARAARDEREADRLAQLKSQADADDEAIAAAERKSADAGSDPSSPLIEKAEHASGVNDKTVEEEEDQVAGQAHETAESLKQKVDDLTDKFEQWLKDHHVDTKKSKVLGAVSLAGALGMVAMGFVVSRRQRRGVSAKSLTLLGNTHDVEKLEDAEQVAGAASPTSGGYEAMP